MKRIILWTTCAGLLLLFTGNTWQAKADTFKITTQWAVYNPANGIVDFAIVFNQAPDFTTLDSVGRVKNNFQYYVIGDASLGYPEEYDSIIRGIENPGENEVTIRNARPSVSDPAAGGWGSIRGKTPFHLSGTTLTFSAPLSLVSDHSTDGIFTYQLQATEFGGETQLITAQSVLPTTVPEPPMLALTLLGAIAIGFLAKFRVVSRSVAQARRST